MFARNLQLYPFVRVSCFDRKSIESYKSRSFYLFDKATTENDHFPFLDLIEQPYYVPVLHPADKSVFYVMGNSF